MNSHSLSGLYNNVGLSRLAAMKELLKCLLIVITETPLSVARLPFGKTDRIEINDPTFETYLAENRARLENLYLENAFDIKEYAEKATGGVIGCSAL